MKLLEPPILETSRLIVRLANPGDISSILEYYETNREFLEPFEPTRPRSFYTRLFWEAHLRETERDFQSSTAVRMFLFDRQDNETVFGYVGFFQIVHRAAYYCTVGYSLSEKHQGRGLMTEGLSAGIQYMFNEMKMHRIMANYMPHNVRSGRLLKRLGFTVEGYARDYLLINGQWEDHVLTSLTNPSWQPV